MRERGLKRKYGSSQQRSGKAHDKSPNLILNTHNNSLQIGNYIKTHITLDIHASRNAMDLKMVLEFIPEYLVGKTGLDVILKIKRAPCMHITNTK